MGMMAMLQLHHGDRDAAREWYARLTRRAEVDPRMARLFADGPTFLGVIPAISFDDSTWIDGIAAAIPRDPAQALSAQATIVLARSNLAADSAASAHAVLRLYESFTRVGAGALPSVAILAAEDVLRRGVTLGPAWHAPLAAARAFSEAARAPWYLAKLDELEAKIRD
jgi:hypothetical protein